MRSRFKVVAIATTITLGLSIGMMVKGTTKAPDEANNNKAMPEVTAALADQLVGTTIALNAMDLLTPAVNTEPDGVVTTLVTVGTMALKRQTALTSNIQTMATVHQLAMAISPHITPTARNGMTQRLVVAFTNSPSDTMVNVNARQVLRL